MTMVVATHEMGFARQVADEVCFLDGGRVLERGAPEVLGDPQHERTRAVPAPDHRGRAAVSRLATRRPGRRGSRR